ncbi:MAG: four helix bundle protein [Candidatus Hydrogenedentes bacterium]|nr:four helix bundle protein [Candidatus Hydrogenedentota bacterium]
METAEHITTRTFNFAVRVVELATFLDSKPGVSGTLAKQLLRAGTSIGANVEEAQGSQSRADFLSKMSIALKEARETLYWLRLLQAAHLCSEKQLAEMTAEANEIVSILVAIVINTRKNNSA